MSWSNGYNYCLLQRGNGYYEDSEDSQSNQETDSSQSSQETDSSQEVIDCWQSVFLSIFSLKENGTYHPLSPSSVHVCFRDD